MGLSLAMGLSVAACSSSTSANSTTTTASGGGSSSLSGTPIVLGSVGSYTQAGQTGSSVNSPGQQPIKAWASWVNTHGGINGHPVKLIVMDDQGNQALAVSDVQQLVQQDHVEAFVSNQDGSLISGYASYLEQQKIPVLGGNIYTGEWTSSPMFYPQSNTQLEGVTAIVTTAKKLGIQRLGSIACAEAVQCSQANAFIKLLASQQGIDTTYQAVVSSTAADYTANCLAAQSAKTQMMVLLIPTADEGNKIATSCSQQNYHPEWWVPGEAIGPGYLSTPSFENTYNSSGTQPWYSTEAATADYHAAMAKYTTINFKTVEEPLLAPDAWASGLMLQEAVKLSGATGLPTSADIVAGLQKFTKDTLGGFVGPLTFTNPTAKVANCFYVTQIKGQKFVLANGGQYLCNAS